MTRNQLKPNFVAKYDSSPIFTVDSGGNVQPTTAQSVAPGGSFLIHSDPAATTPYGGYVCAWSNGACQCSALVSNLGTESHMQISQDAYLVKSTAPAGDYTLYTTMSETGGSGPTPAATTGTVHIGSGG